MAATAFSLRDLHVGMYGAVMGLAGLGLTARAAAPLFPGVFRAPAYFTELWVLLGLVAIVLMLFLYCVKILWNRKSVIEDFTDPGLLGFCGALPVGMALVAGGLAPYLPGIASGLWWIACGVLVAFQVWGIFRWLSGAVDLARINAGWLILMVGGIVVPAPGIALGHSEASHFFFGFSACAAAVLLPLLLARAALSGPLREALRPTWFILLVPPSLIYANGVALFGAEFLEALYYAALVLALALLVYARDAWRWPFGPAWWAFTFPLDALAYAAARYAQSHPGVALWRLVAGGALLLATLAVCAVLLRSLFSLAATLRSAASRAA
jgi:tellurite resistance protein